MSAPLAGFYDAFLDAVLDARLDGLACFLDDRKAAANAIVYRNTSYRGTADALATAYPAVARLAGPAYFEPVAIAYVDAFPPDQRTLAGYGEGFPEFLKTAPGVDKAPYLPDAARLDRAWLSAHRAPGGASLSARALAAVPADRLAGLKLRLHPSARLVELAWDVHEAWRANSTDGGDERVRSVSPSRQHVLLWRDGHEVASQVLDEAEASFFESLADGASLGDAAAAALAVSQQFNTSLVFAGALEAGVFDADQPDIEAKREEWW